MKENVDDTKDDSWRHRVLTLVSIGRELQLIDDILRSLNATAVVSDHHVDSRLREGIAAARRMALDLDRLRTR